MRSAAKIADMGLSWSAALSPPVPGAIDSFSRHRHDAEQRRRKFSEAFTLHVFKAKEHGTTSPLRSLPPQ